MAQRSIRDFQVPFVVAQVADAWASANGFSLNEVEPDGSRQYVRGSGLLTGQMMCVVRQFGPHVRVEAYIHARMAARISALFLIPEDKSIEPGGFMGALPRKICRDAVDRLLAQLGQPPITVADNAAPTVGGLPPAASGAPIPPGAFPTPQPGVVAYPAAAPYSMAPAAPGYRATAARPSGIVFLAIVEVVNGLVCLGVVQDFWGGFNYRASYDDMNWAAVDLGMALVYLVLAGGSVAVAWRLWSMRRDAWLAAIQLSAGMLAATVLSGIVWGLDPIGIVGIVVHASVIGYLYTTPVRTLFGRIPLAARAS
jgi:hypothetical protein